MYICICNDDDNDNVYFIKLRQEVLQNLWSEHTNNADQLVSKGSIPFFGLVSPSSLPIAFNLLPLYPPILPEITCLYIKIYMYMYTYVYKYI